MRTAEMRLFLLSFALALTVSDAKASGGEAKKAGKATPIITTDVLYGTAELLYDVYGEAWGRISAVAAPKAAPLVSAVTAQLPKDPLGELCTKVGVQKKVVMGKWKAAQGAVLHAKSVVAAQSAKAYETLNAMAVQAVVLFEKLMPKYAGLIPKTLGDILLFMAYFAVVLYLVLRVALWLLRTALAVFCCVCCCGCCCGRRKAAPKVVTKGKNQGKVAEKGKAAAATTPAPGNAKKAAKKA